MAGTLEILIQQMQQSADKFIFTSLTREEITKLQLDPFVQMIVSAFFVKSAAIASFPLTRDSVVINILCSNLQAVPSEVEQAFKTLNQQWGSFTNPTP